jgi:hypothetical protein
LVAVCDRRSSSTLPRSLTAARGRCLEKDVIESRLKGARPGFTNLEARTDLGLARTINFDVDLSASGEQRLNRAGSQRRRVAVATQVTQHHPLNPAGRQQLLDDGRRGGIGKMPMARLNALFHRPGAVRIVLQHFFVMIRFDHERVHFAQAFGQHFGGVTKVGNETETAPTRVKSESDRLDRVVRHGKRLHRNVADGEFSPGPEEPPVPMLLEQAVATNGFSSERVAIDRHGKFPTQDFETANMIAVLVCEQDAVQLFGGHAALLEPADELARAQAAVDQNPAVIRSDERTISRAAAAEHGQAKHAA